MYVYHIIDPQPLTSITTPPHTHILQAHIIERVDPKDKDGKPQFLWRVEVMDRKSGTHLGHVFNGAVDG